MRSNSFPIFQIDIKLKLNSWYNVKNGMVVEHKANLNDSSDNEIEEIIRVENKATTTRTRSGDSL